MPGFRTDEQFGQHSPLFVGQIAVISGLFVRQLVHSWLVRLVVG